MLKQLLSLFLPVLLFLFPFFALTQPGMNISGTIAGKENTWCKLAYYLGDSQYIEDPCMTDATGTFRFTSVQPKPSGMYLVYFPDSKSYFDLILDKDQQFTLSSRADSLVEYMRFDGSIDNTQFYRYQNELSALRVKTESLEKARDLLLRSGNTDAAAPLTQSIEEYRIKTAKLAERERNMKPPTFFSRVLMAQKEYVPDPEMDPYMQWVDYKKHYFDYIDWTFDGLLRTPVYHKKIMEYITETSFQHPDSLTADCDRILKLSSASPELYQYTLITLLNHFAASPVVCFDAVYVHLAEKYYLAGKAPWMDTPEGWESLERMRENVEKVKPTLCGAPAPRFSIRTASGAPFGLDTSRSSMYTALVFWNPDSRRSAEEIGRLAEIYTSSRDKGFNVVAVLKDPAQEESWREWIAANDPGWINAMPESKYDAEELEKQYNLHGAPTIFLLDRDMNIVLKKLHIDQLEDYLKQRLF